MSFVELIKQDCSDSQVWGRPVYDGESSSEIPVLNIETSVNKINSVLGVNLSNERVDGILKRLDFSVDINSNGDMSVKVPSYRSTKDIEVEADIIEEIGRIIGYDNINPVAPHCLVRPSKLSNAKSFHRKIRNFLVSFSSLS